jgi:uncharacterized membrane protein
VKYEAGKNRFTLPLYMREPGYYEYTATIKPPPGRDGWAENNVAVGYLYLKGEGKVLLVSDPDGDRRDWETLAATLKRAERLVETAPPFDFPRDPLSLMPYDCVMFVNVAADSFDGAQLQALRDAVYNYGTGFIMVGGKNSFGPGGYQGSPAEEALPVTMDVSQRKVLPKNALVIILHTCEFPEGNTWGKRIAKEAIKVLSAQDEVGILAYGMGGEGWIFKLTPAGRQEELFKLINQADLGDMPTFTTTMRMGLDALKASDAATKHMIIISDGDPSPPTPALLEEFGQSKVSVSTVVVYPHGGMDTSLMKTIAQTTGGRFYHPSDPNLLPSIFIREVKTLRRSMIQNKTFTPRIGFPSPIMKGIARIPELKGYVLTTPKARSTTILEGPEAGEPDPVLAVWRFGLGKTAAWTSDLAPNWAAEWVDWEGYLPFVKQLVTDISRIEAESNLHLSALASGGMGVIAVEDRNESSRFLNVEAVVSGPARRTERIRLRQTGTRRYEGTFGIWGKGRYQIAAAGAGEGATERSFGGFVVPYSAEYLRFRSNPVVLREIAGRTGGRILSGTEKGPEMFLHDRVPRTGSTPLTDIFLIVLACLVPLDVAVRRVQLDLNMIRGWFGLDARKAPSGETLSALLRRKGEVEFITGGGKEEIRPAAAAGPSRKIETELRPAEKVQPAETAAEAQARRLSTTERLLAMKRKRNGKEERK